MKSYFCASLLAAFSAADMRTFTLEKYPERVVDIVAKKGEVVEISGGVGS